VLVTENGDIVCISGRTGKYLELPAGKANMNLFAMAREGLRLELGSALHQAVKQRTKVVQKGIKVTTDGAYQMIDLSVMPIMEPEALRGLLMVVFQAVDSVELPEPARRPGSRAAGVSSVRVAELEKELKLKKEQLQAINDQMSALNEETQSANEELQSANEELQSTNEEVMTSREEMQSLNEELMTVNAELRTKNEELSHSTDDMKNLLNGTEIATIFLDSHLHIKRFTPSITQVFNLIPSDNGRSIGDISLNLMYENLVPDAHKVLETLAAKDLQVTSKDKRWFQMRIMPYRTIANVIDGVVITFMDITQLKELESTLIEREARLQDAEEYASSIIATLHEPFLVLDAEMQITSASLAFCELFKTTQKETEKRSLYTLGNGQWDIPELKVLLEEVLPEKTQFQDFRIEHDFPTIGHKVLTLNARQLHHDKKKRTAPMILLAIEDLTSGSHASADKSYESNKTD
jgi:two-component system CheB/CheR fusion protein